MRVAVMGTGTALGRVVLQRLRAEHVVTSAIRVDLAAHDLRERLLPGVLDGADVVVYCALEPALNRNEDTAFARVAHGCRNVGGLKSIGDLKNVLDIIAKIGARKLVVVSSALVYGAHPDNELSLTEDATLRANPDFTLAYQLMLAEQLVEEWADGHPAVTVTVLRPAITLGPGVEGLMSRHLESPRLPLIRGQSAPLQFVHVDDVAAAVRLAVTTDLPGTFNVAADGWLPVTEVCAILGRRPITFPEATAFEAVRWLWDWGLWHMPPGALHYLMYPCVVTADRLQAYDWTPTRSNREVLREFVEAHHAYLAIGRLRVRRRDLSICAALVAGLLVLWLGGRIKARRQPCEH